jgi:transposase
MASKKGQKKRFWSDEEKRSICAQTRAPGISVAQVARRYAMNANLIFTWLRDPRFAPAALDEAETDAVFLPVEIDGASIDHKPEVVASPGSATAQRIDITLSDGRRVVVEGPTALSAVVGLVQGLMT